MSNRKNNFFRGMKLSIPIFLAYLSVSFTFGIIGVAHGFKWWQVSVISLLTVTSAGQFSGILTMLSPGHYIEMVLSQITINLRYSFMSVSLTQRLNPRFKGISRWLLSFMMTDEVFAIAQTEKEVTRSFFSGLITLPYIGWGVGTIMGALLGNILPENLLKALCLAIYAMFISIITPGIKDERPSLYAVILAVFFSIIFYYCPVLCDLSQGLSITICALCAAIIIAILCPVDNECDSSSSQNGGAK